MVPDRYGGTVRVRWSSMYYISFFFAPRSNWKGGKTRLTEPGYAGKLVGQAPAALYIY